MGMVGLGQQQYGQAVEYLTRAIGVGAENSQVYGQIGMAHLLAGHSKEGVKAYGPSFSGNPGAAAELAPPCHPDLAIVTTGGPIVSPRNFKFTASVVAFIAFEICGPVRADFQSASIRPSEGC
jgi:hypothetical protein